MNNKMLPAELKEHRSASLATCMNNIPRSSPVQYFIGDDMDIYIMSAGGDKFNAIKQNPNVCLLVNTEYINYRKIKGIQVFGRASTSEEDSELFAEARKYSPDPTIMEHQTHSLKVIKIVPQEIVYLDSLEEGDRTKQILVNNQIILKDDETLAVH